MVYDKLTVKVTADIRNKDAAGVISDPKYGI